MKKQTKTYLLLALVLFVWGAIGYQVLGGLSGDDDALDTVDNTKFTPKTVKEREAFNISADYRDPFLGTIVKPRKKTTAKKNTAPKPTVPEADIRFTGYVTDTETKENIFFVSLNGTQLMLSTKETQNKLTLLSGSKSSIKVRYNDKVRTIALQK